MRYHYWRNPKSIPQKKIYGVSSFIPQRDIVCPSIKINELWRGKPWFLFSRRSTIRCDILKASALSTILAHCIAWSINWTHHHNLRASLEKMLKNIFKLVKSISSHLPWSKTSTVQNQTQLQIYTYYVHKSSYYVHNHRHLLNSTI